MDEEIILLGEDGARRGLLTGTMTRAEFDNWALDWALAADALTEELLISAALKRFGREQLLAVIRAAHEPLSLPPIFAQRAEPWGGQPYTRQSGKTFGQAGCFVCSLTSVVAWAGYDAGPLGVARELDARGAFTGAELLRPEVLSQAYPLLGEYRRIDWSGPADIAALQEMLVESVVVVQVDFLASWMLESHFGTAYEYAPDPAGGRNDRLMMMDPWDGKHIDAAADARVNASGKRIGGGYFWPVWWEGEDMAGTEKTRVERLLWGARYFNLAGE